METRGARTCTVRLWRLERGLTQDELALRVGLRGRSAICKIETRGSAGPRAAARLSRVLRVPQNVLFPDRFKQLAPSGGKAARPANRSQQKTGSRS